MFSPMNFLSEGNTIPVVLLGVCYNDFKENKEDVMKRLLSCQPSEMITMNGAELKAAIAASEGRTIMTETVALVPPMLGSISNAELASAFGSDMILLNGLDVLNPVIYGIPETDDPVKTLRDLSGRVIGVNLEPVDADAAMMENRIEICKGRTACAETYKAANDLGFSFICLTGNPGTGVTNAKIAEAIKCAKEHFHGLIIAGKMHAAGVDEPVIDLDSIKAFVEAGADVILMPACGTVPGLQESEIHEACELIRKHGALSMTAIGTSQETSDPETIREFALSSKRAGVDIQHIGDAGWGGVALPENIMAMSIAIRGKRHTYFRMAQSAKR